MAYCNKCGNKIEKNDAFCSNCGSKAEKEAPVVYTPPANYVKPKGENVPAITGFILSLVGLVSCGTFTIPALIVSIMGLVLRQEYNPERKGLSWAGIIISALTIVFLIILFLLPFILVFFGIAVESTTSGPSM